jgi:hypothetical protein
MDDEIYQIIIPLVNAGDLGSLDNAKVVGPPIPVPFDGFTIQYPSFDPIAD